MKSYFNEALKFFDVHDMDTNVALFQLDESEQDSVLLSLTGKLYAMIVDKVDDIDFGDIPDTKGDIEQLPNYEKITTCIATIKAVLQQYKQPTDSIDEIQKALSNLVTRKDIFKRGYMANIEIIQVTYCEMAMAVVVSLSYMIAATIEYVKAPNEDGFQIALDKTGIARTKESMIYGTLKKFNVACSNGQIEKAFEPLIKARVKNLVGADDIAIVAGGMAIVAILANILPILRELTFFFYFTRTRISQYFDLQADLLDMNVAQLELADSVTVDDKKKVIKRQQSISSFFRNISNKVCIDSTQAQKSAVKEVDRTDKKMKINDVVDTTAPDTLASKTVSTSDSLF